MVLTSCASTRLKPEAASIVVSEQPPASACKKVGEVEAHTKVNFANTTKNALLNMIKNDAYDLGGNYLQLTEAANLRHAGLVYKCP